MPVSWGDYWKRRKPGRKRPDPCPPCDAHGCEQKGPMTCAKCGKSYCYDHHGLTAGMCVFCRSANLPEEDDTDDVCDLCGLPLEDCTCHDALLGFPLHCSKD